MSDLPLNVLKKYLDKSINHMSAYGKHHLLKGNYYDLEEGLNSGTFVKLNTKIKIKYFMSLIFQLLIFKNEIFSNDFIKVYKKICSKQNRLFNYDLIIHSIVMKILQDQKVLNGNICTIGDGKANFVHGLLHNTNVKKIFSVNLPQALIQDYLIIKKYCSIDEKLIKVVEKEDDINDKYKLFLIPAENKKYLSNIDINLFVNMFSFQEMPMTEVHEYINLAVTNNSFLYSLNREEKIMYDNTKINYYEYGLREKGKIIFEREAKFQNYFYNGTIPFIHKKNGKVINTLVKF